MAIFMPDYEANMEQSLETNTKPALWIPLSTLSLSFLFSQMALMALYFLRSCNGGNLSVRANVVQSMCPGCGRVKKPKTWEIKAWLGIRG